MLSNAYFLAKFRFDIAENEPAKNLAKFAKFCQFLQVRQAAAGGERGGGEAARHRGGGRPRDPRRWQRLRAQNDELRNS